MIDQLQKDIIKLQEAVRLLGKIKNFLASHQMGLLTSDRLVVLLRQLIGELDNGKS